VPCCSAVAAEHLAPAAVELYLLPASCSAANRYTLLLQSNDRTDGRTDSRPLYTPCSAYYVGSANKLATAESTALLHYFTHFERITQEILLLILAIVTAKYLLLLMLLLLLLLLLHTFNGLFSRTTWVNWYQKGKTSLELNEARNDGVWGW